MEKISGKNKKIFLEKSKKFPEKSKKKILGKIEKIFSEKSKKILAIFEINSRKNR